MLQASLLGSCMQQRVPRLRVHHLTDGNHDHHELKQLTSVIQIRRPRQPVEYVSVYIFSDASFNITSMKQFGQSGIITGLMVESESDALHFQIDLTSAMQKRMTHSFYGTELISSADADDRGYDV